MFEFEVGVNKGYRDETIDKAIQQFKENSPDNLTSKITPHLWEEHCTECAMPECYSTCDLYVARPDGKCRRFENGFTLYNTKSSVTQSFVKIEFKKWSNLQSMAIANVCNVSKVSKIAKLITFLEYVSRIAPANTIAVLGKKGWAIRLIRKLKRKIVSNLINSEPSVAPTHFILELYNPDECELDFTLTIRSVEKRNNKRPYQKRILIKPGYFILKINFFEIYPYTVPEYSNFCSLTPNRDDDSKNPILYINKIGFIETAFKGLDMDSFNKKGKSAKVVIWDLDNTLWNGVLVESENEKLELKPGIFDIIKELDKRGIVNSISSKNNFDLAKKKLIEFGMFDYFVFPEINWNPKSVAVDKIISNFNVGANTVVFIDDSPFEREEVSSQHENLLVMDAALYESILSMEFFNPDKSAESALRREFYIRQGKRTAESVNFKGDYFSFLKDSNIVLNISKANLTSTDRIHELVQRTNQMNFSGNRYTKSEIQEFLKSNEYDAYQIECIDKFGSYGTVGFCIIKRDGLLMLDLMFSCRIQSKRVEHEFLRWLIYRYDEISEEVFLKVFFKETEKNKPVGQVFDDLDFINTARNTRKISLSKKWESEGIVKINYDD